jgi:hypothetical protein
MFEFVSNIPMFQELEDRQGCPIDPDPRSILTMVHGSMLLVLFTLMVNSLPGLTEMLSTL